MVVRTDVAKAASACSHDGTTDLGLVAIGVVDHLFVGVRKLAVDSIGAFVDHILTTFVRNLDDRRAELILVRMNVRIATQPATVDFNVGHAAKLVIMIIALGAPGDAKLPGFNWGHLPEHIHLPRRSVRRLNCHNRDTHISPDVGSTCSFLSEEYTPFLCSKLQVRRVSTVTNELIVTTEDVLSSAHILVKAEKHSALGIVVIVTIVLVSIRATALLWLE